MMRPSIEWQDRGEALYFVADYHALTTLRDPEKLREYSRGIALDFLACGLDSKRAILFRQSDIPGVGDLTWILSTVTPLPMLENAHAYKAQLARGTAPELGLFAYPVLMAIDILMYDSDIVPVGRDQKQHVEIARDLAGRFNRTFGETFRLPEASIVPEVETIPGLDGEKMSKSYDNTLELFLPEKALRKKIMGIVTDSTPFDAPKDPERSTIVQLYRHFADPGSVAQMETDFRAGGIGYGDFKKRLFDAVWEYFAPMRERRAGIEADPEMVEAVLRDGAERARAISGCVVDRVRKAVGLGPMRP
jgi:tryptophanyl-tRNA synthetase